MSQEFSEALNDSLDLLLRGEDISVCLRRFPEHATELEPLLEVAQATMRVADEITPDPVVKAQSFQRFSQAVAALEDRPERRPWWSGFQLRWMQLARPMAAALIVVVIFATGFGATAAASANALPGDPLYWVKTTRENIEQKLPRSDIGKASYEAKLAQVRGDEFQKLVERGSFSRADSTTKRMNNHLGRSARYAGITIVVNPVEMPFRPTAQIGWKQASELRTQLEQDRAIFRAKVRSILAKLPPEDRREVEQFARRTELGYWLLIDAIQTPSPQHRILLATHGR